MQAESDIQAKIENIYKECFGQNLAPEDLYTPLSDAGLDSLDVIDFVYNVESFFDIKLNFDSNIMKKITIQDLIKKVQTIT